MMSFTGRAIAGIAILIALGASSGYAQQQFTQTVTAQNKSCNAGCSVIDLPELNNNFAALIFVTPVLVNGVNLNPHPIGAYYMYLQKWSIFNLDGTPMVVGAKFNVQYYVNPDSDRFVYIVPQRVHVTDAAYLDRPGLNNNPNAQIRVFPTTSPTRGAIYDKYDLKVEYDVAAARWFLANVNNTPVPSDSAYNIMFAGGPVAVNPNANRNPTNGPAPVSTSANVNAGGDLSGTYPNPTVIGLQGRPLSSDAPAIGQILKWNGTAWTPANETVPNTVSPPPTPTAAKATVLYFNQSSNVEIKTANSNIVEVAGLNNQSFTVAQSSRLVYATTITAQDEHSDGLGNTGGSVNVWLEVVILNASNNVVGRAINYTQLFAIHLQSMNAVGTTGVLPAGTYHTRVTLHRAGTDEVRAYAASSQIQGGQMVLEIFPD